MITYVEESLHEVGGYVVKFSDGHDFHWYDEMRKSPRSVQVGQALKTWMETNTPVSKADAEKVRAQDLELQAHSQAAEAEKRQNIKDKRKEKIIKELEAGNFSALAEIL